MDRILIIALREAGRRWRRDRDRAVRRIVEAADGRPELLQHAAQLAPYPVVPERSTKETRLQARDLIEQARRIVAADQVNGRPTEDPSYGVTGTHRWGQDREAVRGSETLGGRDPDV